MCTVCGDTGWVRVVPYVNAACANPALSYETFERCLCSRPIDTACGAGLLPTRVLPLPAPIPWPP